MKELFCSFLIFCSTASCLAQNRNQPKPIKVSVRALAQTVIGSVLYLKGDVEIGLADKVIRANEAEYNLVTGAIQAQGNVRAAKVGFPIELTVVAERFETNTNTPDECAFTFRKMGMEAR